VLRSLLEQLGAEHLQLKSHQLTKFEVPSSELVFLLGVAVSVPIKNEK
jgi:hypothetical protein